MVYGVVFFQMDAAAELGRNPVVSRHQIRPVRSMEMSRLAQGGTAESVSRDQILRRERGQGKKSILPVQLTTSRSNGNFTRLIHSTLAICDGYTYILCWPYATNIGEPIKYHEEILSLQPIFPPKSFDIPLDGQCSGG